MTLRLFALSAVLLAALLFVHPLAASPLAPRRLPFAQFPMAVGEWRSAGAIAIDDGSLRVLNADDYISRQYVRGGAAAGLFAAYYASQREGDTMHSPLNCLPAAGWQPMHSAPVAIAIRGAQPILANRVVIQKGLDKQLVLYWYQSHGRTIANEYASKAFLVLDSLRLHRSDAALVRIAMPFVEPAADGDAVDFARAVRPLLDAYIPRS